MPSPVDPPDLTPQPGAVFWEEGFIPNGLPNEDLVHEGWPKLPGDQAVNFVMAEPCLLFASESVRHVLRVWGDPAWDIGRYWSMTNPQTAGQFYGGLSVELHWNSGLYQAELRQATPGKLKIMVWRGPTARQPAELLDASGQLVKLSTQYFLPGGDIQYYIPFEYFTSIFNQKTAWNAPASQSTEIDSIRIAPLPAQQLPEGMEPATYGKLLEALGRLATLLRQIEANAGSNNPLLGAKDGFLSRSAELLVQAGKQLNQHLSSAATDADAKVQATLTLWSLVATGRHVDGNFSFSGQQEAVDQAINDVVTAAYALAQGIGDQEA